MNIEIVSSEKNDVEFKIDNPTVAEVLRAYLYQEGIDFAAWKREHPSKPLIMKIQSSSKAVKKVVEDAVSSVKSDCDKIMAVAKK